MLDARTGKAVTEPKTAKCADCGKRVSRYATLYGNSSRYPIGVRQADGGYRCFPCDDKRRERES